MSEVSKHSDNLHDNASLKGTKDCLSSLTATTPLIDLLSHDSVTSPNQISDSYRTEERTKKDKTKKKKKDKEKEKGSSRIYEGDNDNQNPNSYEISLESETLEKLRHYLKQYLSQRSEQECIPENLQMLLDPDVVGYLSQQLLLQSELVLRDDCSVNSDLTEATGFRHDNSVRNSPLYDEDHHGQYGAQDDGAIRNHAQSSGDQDFRTRDLFCSNASSSSHSTSSQSHAIECNSCQKFIPLRSCFLGSNTKCCSPRKLKFSSVSVRCYERILTIHPSTVQGPSIGIGWNYQSQPIIPLDAYESIQKSQTKSSRSISSSSSSSTSSSTYLFSCRILSRDERVELLRQLGVTDSQIASGVRENAKLRHQRAQSIQTIGAFQLQSLFGRMLQRGWNSKPGAKLKKIR
jgi:hypothetical protein